MSDPTGRDEVRSRDGAVIAMRGAYFFLEVDNNNINDYGSGYNSYDNDYNSNGNDYQQKVENKIDPKKL